MTLLQLLFTIFLFLYPQALLANIVTKPYLGFGQMSLSLGNESLIKGESSSYVLGAQTGIMLGPNFYLALDYTRAGPYSVKFKNNYYGTSIDSGFFTLYSGGVGIEYTRGSWMLWYGTYPYHALEEHRIDFQMKGTMTRTGLGFTLDSKLSLYFHYEKSNLSIKDPTSTARNIICYTSPTDECSLTGRSSTLFFSLVATLN